MNPHALWWWIDRWRKSTAYMDMTLEEQGAYRNLLDEATLRGGALPDEDRILAKACGDARRWHKVRTKVMARFTFEHDGWHNTTLDEVLHESKRRADKQREWRNTRGNGRGNAVSNAVGNKARPPVPVPVPDLKEEREKIVSLSQSELTQSHGNGTHAKSDPFTDESITARAGAFVQRYAALYPVHRHGARYAIKPVRDYAAAVTLCTTWPDDNRLEKLAICFLTTDHKFAEEGSRTLAQFLALSSWVDGELCKWEVQHP